ncbi:Sodium-driven chloride bicarbonate exchanger [Hypsibius exemplaris]|uniref:Anion exchange protein n=1 Tax=Hypsibius exemplaris TaxID=2072580 RepID=A0A1W0XCB6_HYPEX|nr:Sodium-driven chloride bicarbonate exchanger [Hypsibius exemplaris]
MDPTKLFTQADYDLVGDIETRSNMFSLGVEDGPDQDQPQPFLIHLHRPLFCELIELKAGKKHGTIPAGDQEWRETARWVKFEENVEEGGNRWSKPFVASLPLHSLMELRSCLTNGLILWDIEASNLLDVWNLVVDEWVQSGSLEAGLRDAVLGVLLQRHKHQSQRRIRPVASRDQDGMTKRSLSEYFRSASSNILDRVDSGYGRDRSGSITHHSTIMADFDSGTPTADGSTAPARTDSVKANMHFFKKLPGGVEAANILIAELDILTKPVHAFIRLAKPTVFGNLTEVPAPTRFIFVLLGPKSTPMRYHQVGRTMGTLLSDELFQHAVYDAKGRPDILRAVDEFLGAATVLPPGEWDPSIRIEPPAKVQTQGARLKDKFKREGSMADFLEIEEAEAKEHAGNDHGGGIIRTGRFCGGLIADIKRKVPFYLSDFRDALHMQSLASFIFLYFASMTPLITFGGLMSDLLKKRMGAMETILGRAFSGVVWGFTAGQPLVILGSTGPILVFELIVFNLCESFGIEYLSFRVWIGLWSMLQLLVMVAFDLSFLVSYITRFTEESFAALVSAIFVYEAFKKLFHIAKEEPLRTFPERALPPALCDCRINNETLRPLTDNFTKAQCLESVHFAVGNVTTHGSLVGPECNVHAHVPDAFLLSVLLFFGTYIVARILKDFKTSPYLPTRFRQFVSDFAVIISISLFVTLDFCLGIPTPKLSVPQKLEPTYDMRNGSWIVPPFGDNPWWTALAAFIPGLLATILIFMDQQITSVIVNRKENRFRKGSGYHLDLLVVAILTGLLSLLGMPWMIADTVLSLTHVASLKMESDVAAPGEHPTFLGVREQRITNIAISIAIGTSIFMTVILQVIPMPVLFGVFLFMGLNALNGLQFTDRLKLIFMPLKYQPDYYYLRHVRITKVHVFTGVQLLCLAVLWVLKSFLETAMLFPIMVGALVGVRKLLDYIFTQFELSYLDDIIPESVKRKKEDRERRASGHNGSLIGENGSPPNVEDGFLRIRLPTGNYLTVPVGNSPHDREASPPLNFTEEVNKTGIWRHVSSANLRSQVNESEENALTVPSTGSRWKRSDVLRLEDRQPLSLSPVPDSPDEQSLCGK